MVLVVGREEQGSHSLAGELLGCKQVPGEIHIHPSPLQAHMKVNELVLESMKVKELVLKSMKVKERVLEPEHMKVKEWKQENMVEIQNNLVLVCWSALVLVCNVALVCI